MAVVYAVTTDLFFGERLERALQGMGHKTTVIDLSADPAPAALPQGVDLAIIDLEAGALEQVQAARRAGVRVLAFGPHVEVAARRAAEEAGAQVVAKSQLTRSFEDLVNAALAGPS